MIRKAVSAAVSLFVVGILIFLWLVRGMFFGSHTPTLVRIEKGSGARQIAKLLHSSNVIDSPAAFLLISKLSGKSKAFHYGPYLFERNRYGDIVRKISRGETHKVKVVIPEGWSAGLIGQRLVQEGILSEGDPFLETALSLKWEGKLYPETYFLEPMITSTEAAKPMLDQFGKIYTAEMEQRAKALRLTQNQILILASIIEREARVDEDRAVISSVYHNRLKKRMPLQADPTVQYALSLGKVWKENLSRKDLKFKSPYNTYVAAGLPPAPICNPGLKSIEAALNPAQTKFLYFVADGTGKHRFSSTNEEHLRIRHEIRKNTSRR